MEAAWLIAALFGSALGLDLQTAVRPNCTVGVVLSPDGLIEDLETFLDKNVGRDIVVYASEKEANHQQVGTQLNAQELSWIINTTGILLLGEDS